MFWRRNSACSCCCGCPTTVTCCSCCTCCTCCRCNSCSCGCNSTVSAPAVETYYQRVRYLDMPMTTYYGEGYTEVDCCVSTNATLRDISATLKNR